MLLGVMIDVDKIIMFWLWLLNFVACCFSCFSHFAGLLFSCRVCSFRWLLLQHKLCVFLSELLLPTLSVTSSSLLLMVGGVVEPCACTTSVKLNVYMFTLSCCRRCAPYHRCAVQLASCALVFALLRCIPTRVLPNAGAFPPACCQTPVGARSKGQVAARHLLLHERPELGLVCPARPIATSAAKRDTR